MKIIKWGFIGCGDVTERKSGPAFNEVEGSQIEAVMSRSEQKARSYAERHHIGKYYTDAQKLIDNPDVKKIWDEGETVSLSFDAALTKVLVDDLEKA